MIRKKHKIEVATPDEVKQYTAESAEAESEVSKTGPADESAQEGAGSGEGDAPAAEDELAALRSQVEEFKDKHLRAVAEHQNYVRRSAAERTEYARYAAADLARALLGVVDDLERTLAAIPADEAPTVVEGIRLVYDNLLKCLATHHVERIAAKGEPFDPACHEAMMQQPCEDHPPGTVIEEFQPGYKLWDRVLRPAKVVVSQAPPSDTEQPVDTQPDEASPDPTDEQESA